MRTDRPMSMIESGGLSTVMKFDGSSGPEEPGVQLCEPRRAAAE